MLVRNVLAALGIASTLALGAASWATPAVAADVPKTVRIVGADAASRRMILPSGKSMVLELDEDVRDVMVSNPVIADAVVRSARRVYIVGNAIGSTNVFLFGQSGQQIVQIDLRVEPDPGALAATISRLVPGCSLNVEMLNGAVVLTGTALSPADAKRAEDLAAQFLGGDDKGKRIVNAIKIKGKDQVHLKVTVAEVQREVVKQLGIDLTAVASNNSKALINTFVFTNNPLNIFGKTLPTSEYQLGTCFNDACTTGAGATLRALEQTGLLRTLAEPTLTAVSGEEANFLVGGEFPVPVGSTNENGFPVIKIEFKKFGVSLGFIPVVLSEGRISLKVKTEVSELTNDSAVLIDKLRIPGLRVRRADSTMELPSGGSMVMAGLLRDDVKSALNGTPGLMDLPILGALFKSRDFQRSQTELAIFVTPYIVDPVATSKLVRPDENYQPDNDAHTIFLSKINRLYRGRPLPGNAPVPGRYGFIYD